VLLVEAASVPYIPIAELSAARYRESSSFVPIGRSDAMIEISTHEKTAALADSLSWTEVQGVVHWPTLTRQTISGHLLRSF
jgi:hypothetical protein